MASNRKRKGAGRGKGAKKARMDRLEFRREGRSYVEPLATLPLMLAALKARSK